jgi:hypothetical protein
MATEPTLATAPATTSAGMPPAATLPLRLLGLTDKKAMLEEKIKRIQAMPKSDHPSFNHDEALQRAQMGLAEVNKALAVK